MPVTDARESLEKATILGQEKSYIAAKGLVRKYPNSSLTEFHGRLLDESGLNADVVEARNYISVLDGRFFTEVFHIPSWRSKAPCLMIPIWDVTGNAGYCQIRPDNPRIVDGKVIKYESLPQSRLRLDIPPAVLSSLSDPKIPLIITEGARKADSAISHGIPAISLIGVWGFRGQNIKGGKARLEDWEYIALNGRKIRIAFDSDVVTKSSVAVAMQRLRIFLCSRGAIVETIYFPSPEEGGKVGLDDFLATHKPEELDAFVSKDFDVKQEKKETIYEIIDNRFVMSRGESQDPLCNFHARIEHEELRDDGLLVIPFYKITGQLQSGERLPPIDVSVEEYSGMLWIEKEWRTKVYLSAGNAAKQHLSTAIKMHSLGAGIRYIYRHTGWRNIEGEWHYLYNTGIIPADTPVEPLLEGTLQHCILERHNENAPSPRKIIDELLLLGKDELVLPLLAATFTAPLGEWLSLDFGIHIEGPTGTFKSELTALMQGFWGRDFNARHFVENWTSTANSIERKSHMAKDMIFTVDDFIPALSKPGQERMQDKAEQVFRGAGNQAGRGRLSVDLTLRPQYFPRGLILSTGEQGFEGQSLNARIIQLQMQQEDIFVPQLTKMQLWRDYGYFSHVMYDYISWLADNVPYDASLHYTNYLDELAKFSSHHRRNISAMSKLLTGVHYLALWLNYPELMQRAMGVAESLMEHQSAILREGNVADKAIGLLRSGFESGRIWLDIDPEIQDTDLQELYGVKRVDAAVKNLGTNVGFMPKNRNVCLIPNAVFESCWRHVGSSRRAVLRELHHAGWLEIQDGGDEGKMQYAKLARFRGTVRRAYVLLKPLWEKLPEVSQTELSQPPIF